VSTRLLAQRGNLQNRSPLLATANAVINNGLLVLLEPVPSMASRSHINDLDGPNFVQEANPKLA
jgi:hypothetical protein